VVSGTWRFFFYVETCVTMSDGSGAGGKHDKISDEFAGRLMIRLAGCFQELFENEPL
jgi:hypothetical protein